MVDWLIDWLVFNPNVNNISDISWRSTIMKLITSHTSRMYIENPDYFQYIFLIISVYIHCLVEPHLWSL
jgi:hypothetical protein